jgi:hypothetical protein
MNNEVMLYSHNFNFYVLILELILSGTFDILMRHWPPIYISQLLSFELVMLINNFFDKLWNQYLLLCI